MERREARRSRKGSPTKGLVAPFGAPSPRVTPRDHTLAPHCGAAPTLGRANPRRETAEFCSGAKEGVRHFLRSFPRKRESSSFGSKFRGFWVPAFAGTNGVVARPAMNL